LFLLIVDALLSSCLPSSPQHRNHTVTGQARQEDTDNKRLSDDASDLAMVNGSRPRLQATQFGDLAD